MDEKIRLDALVSQKYPHYSRSWIQKCIKSGQVRLSGAIETKPSAKVSENQKIELLEVAPPQFTKTLDIAVLYEDTDCVVIDKPVGVLSHSKGVHNPELTVATWLKDRPGFSFPEYSDRSGIVHRLDRATSGVMVCAKNQSALGFLQKQFQLRKAKKSYRALVSGHLKEPHAILELPIERNPKSPQKFRVGVNGKSALTEYRVISKLENSDYIELKPTTGRTHQLRVHLSYLGHPIIGDTLYGGILADRMFLHAYSLEITLPDCSRRTFVADLPLPFQIEVEK